MATKSALKVVTDDMTPTRKKPLTVRGAADSGNRRDLLVALRARIASDIDDTKTPARDLAALSRRLLEIAREVDSIDATEKGDDVGDAADTPDEPFSAS